MLAPGGPGARGDVVVTMCNGYPTIPRVDFSLPKGPDSSPRCEAGAFRLNFHKNGEGKLGLSVVDYGQVR